MSQQGPTPNPFDPPQSFAQQGQPTGQGYPPGAPVPPPAPAPQPPAPEPKQRSWFARHKILTALGAILVIVVLAQLFGGGDGDEDATPASPSSASESAADDDAASSDSEPASEEPTTEAPEPAAAGIGTPVQDGKFEFTVTGIETGVASVGSDVLGDTAQGQFVMVNLTIANIGNEAQTFYGDNATLIDTQGREHSSDDEAWIYLDNSDSLYSEINPGNTVQTVVVYDIPADAVPASLELHDSFFSGGVTVALQ